MQRLKQIVYLAKCVKVELKLEISVDLESSEQAPTDTAPRNSNLRVWCV